MIPINEPTRDHRSKAAQIALAVARNDHAAFDAALDDVALTDLIAALGGELASFFTDTAGMSALALYATTPAAVADSESAHGAAVSLAPDALPAPDVPKLGGDAPPTSVEDRRRAMRLVIGMGEQIDYGDPTQLEVITAEVDAAAGWRGVAIACAAAMRREMIKTNPSLYIRQLREWLMRLS